MLPAAWRQKLIKHGLIEGTLDEKIPTLGVFLARYVESRAAESKDVKYNDKRYRRYLTEYFGLNTRLDLIKPEKAEGLKSYLLTERKAGRGTLMLSSANKVIRGIKTLFGYAVRWGHIEKNPFAAVKCPNVVAKDRVAYILMSRSSKPLLFALTRN